MAETSFNTRIQNKVDTTSNWSKASSFVPKNGEIIIYSDGGGTGQPKMKVGDGSTTVGNLKFIDAQNAAALTSNAGSASTPVYFSSGVPVAITSYSGNAASATKLQTKHSITITGGAKATAQYFDGTQDVSLPIYDIYESYLAWGGKAGVSNISPLSAALSDLHSANRAQFSKAAGMTAEYSNDGGTTWADYEASDQKKISFLSGLDQTFFAGRKNGMATTEDQLRITINATACGFYTALKIVLINFSRQGATCKVKIEKTMGSSETYTEIGTYAIAGYSDWNSYPIVGPFGGGNDSSHITNLRFTFFSTAKDSDTVKGNFCVYNMLFFGTTYWVTPSSMARTGHLYSWDYQQNATFPGTVKASSFLGTATQVSNSLSINGKTYNGSAAIDVGTIGAAYGGSGKTSLVDSANAFINALATGSTTPEDDDYFISQWVGGGTSTTTFHRRKISTLYSYMKNKMDSVYQAKGTYLTSLPTASATTLGGIKVGTGLTMSSDVLNHSNSITAKTSFGSTATSASANGGSITVTDIKYDAQGHITSSQDRTITLSQTTYTLAGLGGVPTTRTVNGKALSNDISLTYSDVNAAASSHTHSAYVNQNAFSNVTIGTTTISADTTTDTIALVAGDNITLTPDATNDKITIAAKDTTYTLASLMGSAAKGSTTQPVYWNGSSWQNTTYTLGASVPSGAKFTDTVYTLPVASSTLGGVKTTSTITSTSGLTACPIIEGVPYYKDTNTTYTLAGLMGSAAKGSTTQPVYWNGSAWTNTTYTLGASVPSNAKFTDTVYTLPVATTSTLGGVIVGSGLTAASDGTISVEDNSQTDTITIAAADWSGSGPYTVSKTVAHSYDTSTSNVVISLPTLTTSDSTTYEAIATAKIAISSCSGTTVSFVAYGTKPAVSISLVIAQF